VPAGTHDGVAACIRLDEVHRPTTTLQTAATESPEWPPQSTTLADYGNPGDPALILSGVTKEFSLRGAKRGLALVGESGCGKSTLLRVVAGLLDADEGSVNLGEGARPQIVFQDAGASLTPWLTIGELIGERLSVGDVGRMGRKERVAEALALVGLPADVAAAKPSQLSGGQRQRAAIARAIVIPPALLLCDEPTSALDVSLAATALNLLGRLRRELGMSLLFVTHDLAAARLVADRIAVMYLGRIVEMGPVDQVCEAPEHPYTKVLLRSVPGPGVRHAPLDGEPASPLAPPSGCAFHPRCPVVQPECADHQPAMTVVNGHAAACVHAGARAVEIDLNEQAIR
jgi:peptide/nickel transport system ATP-binding protein